MTSNNNSKTIDYYAKENNKVLLADSQKLYKDNKIWFEDKEKLTEFAEFLVESGELTTAKELLNYFKYPYIYAESYALYQREKLYEDNKEDRINITDIDKLVIIEEVSTNNAMTVEA